MAMGDTPPTGEPADDDMFLPPGGATGDALWDDWDTPPRVPDMPVLHLDGFDGPMDQLLDLVERKRIDFAKMSPLAIVDQLIAAMDLLAQRVSLDRRADWIIMGARLVHLRSRFLLPASPEVAAEAERELEKTVALLEERAAMRKAASWLDARTQLGRDVFTRPAGRDPRVASYMALMEACLSVLKGRGGEPEEAAVYRLVVGDLWTMAMARVRIRTVLAELPKGGDLISFVPRIPEGAARVIKVKAAVAGTLLASLEMAREGEVLLEQEKLCDPIVVIPR